MSLCEALHGRRPWPELELPWEPMGELTGEGKEGEGEEGEGGAARVQLGCHREGCCGGARWLLLCSFVTTFCM
jgi:hypothetical protein